MLDPTRPSLTPFVMDNGESVEVVEYDAIVASTFVS